MRLSWIGCMVGLGLVMAAAAPCADAAVIARWSFENIIPPDVNDTATNGPHSPDVGTGAASGVHASALTDWTTPAGNGSTNAYSSNEWAIGDYYQFMTSTTGFSGITLLFDQTRSGTGPAAFKVQYSTDGSTFLDAPGAEYNVAQITFSSGTEQATSPPRFGFDFSSITALDNQPSVTFRLVATGAATGTAGTNRVDNVIIGTDPVPEPTGLTTLALAAAALTMRRRRH